MLNQENNDSEFKIETMPTNLTDAFQFISLDVRKSPRCSHFLKEF